MKIEAGRIRSIKKRIENPFPVDDLNENKTFREKIESVKNKEAIQEIMANPHHPLMKLAEDLLKDKEIGFTNFTTEENYKNMVGDTGHDPALLAAICEELEKHKIKSTATH